MRRSKYRRETQSSKWFSGRRRIIAAVATLVAFGGIVTVTQVSDASTRKGTQRALAACDNIQAPKATKLSKNTRHGTYTTNGGKVTQHADDGSEVPSKADMRKRCRDWVMQNTGNNGGGQNNGGGNNGGNAGGASAQPSAGASASTAAGNGGQNNGGGNNGGGSNNGGGNNGGAATPPPGAGLGVLANTCDDTKLPLHDGFQKGDRCVTTEFGEVGSAANNPSLLIVDAPTDVDVNQPFTIKVSTRNLIRDRFLGAAAGGYYVESSLLKDGLVRGHFHTACRPLQTTDAAPAPDPVPDFFVATEDSKGNATPDVVSINVPGIKNAGLEQCASWAGDGSHRIPMMERANQTPAFDAVRINVKAGGGNNGGGNAGGANNGGANNGGQQAGGNGGQQAGANNGGQQAGNNNNGQPAGANNQTGK